MKEHVRIPARHPSYQNHRRQFGRHILLPIILSASLIIALAVLSGLATFSEGGDSARWAAISTIWLVIPVMGFGLFFLLILAGLIYLLARALKGLPPYTYKAQYYFKRAVLKTRQISDQAVSPILYLDGLFASLRAPFRKK